jgi:hypothetical protein
MTVVLTLVIMLILLVIPCDPIPLSLSPCTDKQKPKVQKWMLQLSIHHRHDQDLETNKQENWLTYRIMKENDNHN